jgi:hypothetical protein
MPCAWPRLPLAMQSDTVIGSSACQTAREARVMLCRRRVRHGSTEAGSTQNTHWRVMRGGASYSGSGTRNDAATTVFAMSARVVATTA